MEDEPRRGPPWLKLSFAFLWAMPWTALGLVVGITIIGLPITFLFLWVGCYPLARLAQNYINYTVEWQDRDHALGADASKPWEEEECELELPMFQSTIERER